MISLRGGTTACVCAAASLLFLVFSEQAAAQPGAIDCLRTSKGPCQTPDAFDYLPGSVEPGLVLTNFGLLFPGANSGEWQIVCDDNFGLAPVGHIRLAPSGKIFAASYQGLYFSASPDGCEWARPAGDVGAKPVFDVDFDGKEKDLVWALAASPPVLWRSLDEGRSFAVIRSFDPSLGFHRLRIAPSDGRFIYLAGRGSGSGTPFASSSDGGQTFEILDLASGASPPPASALELAAIAPDDPRTLYFVVFDVNAGDEVWRSTDGGKTVSRLLKLTGLDAFGGLAFGLTPQTLYVAGTHPLPVVQQARGRLHISRDGGQSWLEPVPTDTTGPSYSCLTFAEGKLYACGNGARGEFLVGVTMDEGKTWAPVARLNQVMGAKSCVRSQCLTTETWLCDSYGQCPPGVEPTPTPPVRPGDAGPAPATAAGEGGGCACELTGRGPRAETPPAAGGWAWLLLVALAVLRRTRRRA